MNPEIKILIQRYETTMAAREEARIAKARIFDAQERAKQAFSAAVDAASAANDEVCRARADLEHALSTKE